MATGSIKGTVVRAGVMMMAALFAATLGGCCKGQGIGGENRMAWAANDRGEAIVDVTRRSSGNQIDNAVVRSGPGFQYPQIASLRTGTRVVVLDNARSNNGNWSRISFPNGEGWIHQDILLKAREFQGGDAASFAGTYDTNYGTCTLRADGGQVTGSCSDTTRMRCSVQGINLTCGWSTDSTGRQGQARLSKHANGSLVGTWGYNNDNLNGGTWKFTRR